MRYQEATTETENSHGTIHTHLSDPQNRTMMLVVCLEGCHGVGKSSLVLEFEKQGFHVLDEMFLDMEEHALHPQSLLMETTWVCSWFEKLLRLKYKFDKDRVSHPVVIADRSPFSAVLYANRGELLEPIIREQISEVQQKAGIKVLTVHVSVDKETLWQRIKYRLQREPSRRKLGEHKKERMERALSFYQTFQWDMTVSNGDGALEETSDRIICQLAALHGLHRSKACLVAGLPNTCRDEAVSVGVGQVSSGGFSYS